MNLVKEFVKVKTYSDLLVLKQDANDKRYEPARWVMHVSYFDKGNKVRRLLWLSNTLCGLPK